MEVAKRIYIGGGETWLQRLRNIKKLADRYTRGNVSALFNEALNEKFRLDPETGEPLQKDKGS